MSKATGMKNQTGIISDIRYVAIGDGKMCEVKVEVDGRDTNWLPKVTKVGGAFKLHVPPRVGDQVMVHNENGKHEDGYVTDNIAFEKVPHHEAISEDNIVMWSEDGTTYIHSLKDKIISLNTPCEINVTSEKDVTIKAPNIKLDGDVEITGDLDVTGDIDTDGSITDERGDLTNHMNAAFPRV